MKQIRIFHIDISTEAVKKVTNFPISFPLVATQYRTQLPENWFFSLYFNYSPKLVSISITSLFLFV